MPHILLLLCLADFTNGEIASPDYRRDRNDDMPVCTKNDNTV